MVHFPVVDRRLVAASLRYAPETNFGASSLNAWIDSSVEIRRMPESPHAEIQREIADLVKRELFTIGELRELEEKLKGIAERAAKMTPLPEWSRGEDD